MLYRVTTGYDDGECVIAKHGPYAIAESKAKAIRWAKKTLLAMPPKEAEEHAGWWALIEIGKLSKEAESNGHQLAELSLADFEPDEKQPAHRKIWYFYQHQL